MISFIKSLFKDKKTENLDTESLESIRKEIEMSGKDTRTPRLSFPEGFDPDKPTLIILDDSAGATMLFDDTIYQLKSRSDGIADGIQFVKISTAYAVFMLEGEVELGNLNNIVGAVLDITIGGWALRDGKIVILDGIDAYDFIRKRFPNAVMRFYTSHSMNEKNAEIYKFMVKYKELTGDDIQNVTYMKDPFSTNRMDMMIDILTEIKNNETS